MPCWLLQGHGRVRARRWTQLVSLLPLREDMSLPMALTDKWTIWMVVIAIVELVLVLVGRHWKDVDDEDQEQQA